MSYVFGFGAGVLLDGCAPALKSRDVTADQVAAVQEPAPAETLVSETDMATARRWLVDTLEEDLEGNRQKLMIVGHVLENGWGRQSGRLSSLMLAVVETADVAVSQPVTHLMAATRKVAERAHCSLLISTITVQSTSDVVNGG